MLDDYRRREDDDGLMAMPDLEDPQDEWEVEEVLDKRKVEGTLHYLVKWTGWPSEYNSYEPASYLENAPDAIRAFERKLKRKQKARQDKDNDKAPSRPLKRKKVAPR